MVHPAARPMTTHNMSEAGLQGQKLFSLEATRDNFQNKRCFRQMTKVVAKFSAKKDA